MKESAFVEIFEKAAANVFGKELVVKRGANLFYELTLDKALELCVKDTRSPKRGNSAFQTDICIFELVNSIEFPRIAIEFKTKINTHDIITYSAKAGKHKRIYPGLRYGLIAGDLESIPNRFFIHNDNLDFFVAAAKYKSAETLFSFARDLIKKEVEISRILEQIYFDNKKYDYYRTDVIFKNFGDK